ncbi:MAG: EAL domain-containing protein [Sulfuriferula sp.]
MKPIMQAVAPVLGILGIDEADLARRKAFLGFTDADAERLRQLHEIQQTLEPGYTDVLLNHLLTFSATCQALPRIHSLNHLKHTLASYLSSLSAGNYDQQCNHDRLRLGIVHRHTGLSPESCIGTYCKYLCDLIPEIWKQHGHDHTAFLAACQSLIKIVLLDIGLVIDTHIETDRQTIRSLKEYAEIVFTNIPDGLLVLTSQLVILSANQPFLNRFGLTPEQVQNRSLMDVLTADGLQDRLFEVLSTGVTQHNLPFIMVSVVSGARKPVRATLTGIYFDDNREAARLLLIVEDISEAEKLRLAALESELRFRDLAENTYDGIIMTDLAGKIVYLNPAAARMFGYRRRQAIKQPISALLPVRSIRQLTGKLRRMPPGETHACRRDGTLFPVESSSSVFEGAEGRYTTYVLRDLTERKHFEDQLLHLTNHDPLTNLPNRKFFRERVTAKLNYAALDERLLSLLFIDLKRFKQINDTFGHAMGDQLLVLVTERLSGCVRKDDILARFGGDEFIIASGGLVARQDAALIAQKILDILIHPFELEGQEFFISASIGIAFYLLDATKVDDLIRCADRARCQAKNQGLGYQFYRSELESLSERFTLENSLRKALERNQFHLYYQPKVDLDTGAVIGLEALLRWMHPMSGIIPPDQFIPLAEETGIIIPIGEWVLSQACQQIKTWQQAGFSVPVSVNLSARQFSQSTSTVSMEGKPAPDEMTHYLVATVNRILEETQIDPSCLELEITESILMQNLSTTVAILQSLSSKGIRISIDDFGTGYSSLSYLKRLPIHIIKIDKTFVRDITTDQDDAAIVSAIIAMARSLRLKVVAEGVETREQFDFLHAQGCDAMQGYFFSKPLPADEIPRLLRKEILRQP